jgi:hypothetical protein
MQAKHRLDALAGLGVLAADPGYRVAKVAIQCVDPAINFLTGADTYSYPDSEAMASNVIPLYGPSRAGPVPKPR